jgi:hypothetical protein
MNEQQKQQIKLIDRVYNGAWENLQLAPPAKRAFGLAGGIIILGFILNYQISKNGKL